MTAINTDWVRQATSQKKGFGRDRQSGGGSNLRFAKLPRTGVAKFRCLPPDNQGRLGTFVGRHYNLVTGEMKDGKPVTTSAICIESSFPDRQVVCQVCEGLRQLRDAGVDENTLGDYEPAMKSYAKAIMHEPKMDDKGPFSNTEPVLLEMTEYSLTWILQQTLDPDVGDFLSPIKGAVIKFSREKSDGKWERKILDSSAEGGGPLLASAEDLDKLLEASEAIDLYNIWKMPDDEYLGKIKDWADKTVGHIKKVTAEKTQLAEGIEGKTEDVPAPEYKAPVEEPKPTEQKKEEPSETPTIQQLASEDPPFDADPPKTETQPTTPPVALETKNPDAPPVHTAATSGTAGPKPSGSPECFGDKGVYDPNANKCVMCDYEFECGDRISKS